MPREFNLDDLVGSVVDRWGPATADMSLWACGLLVFPVDEKMIGIQALLLIGLPVMIAARRTDQLDLVVPAFSRAAIWHPRSLYPQDAAPVADLCA
jgi:hypothetical protein